MNKSRHDWAVETNIRFSRTGILVLVSNCVFCRIVYLLSSPEVVIGLSFVANRHQSSVAQSASASDC